MYFLRGHPRDGRLVQFEGVGDIAQHQRLHGLFAVLEEAVLQLDDLRRHAQHGVVAAAQALDEPSRLL
jgi:hypothetical protein